MKQLLRKRWVRILVRTVIGGLTLLVLAVVIFNWQAARDKARAIAAAKAAGFPLTLGDFSKGMPPDAENFARTGLMRAWETFYSQPGRATPVPGSPEEAFGLLADESYRKVWQKDRKNGGTILDFASLPKDGPLGQTAESFLAEYERRNGQTIRELQSGFSLPYARRAFVQDGITGTEDGWVMLREELGLKSRFVFDGLEVRAEAALLTGDAQTAAESIELSLRMGDAVGSRGTTLAVLVEELSAEKMMGPLRNGVNGHRWREEDLSRIQRAVARLQTNGHARQALQSEMLTMHLWQGLKDDRSRMSSFPFLDVNRPSFSAWLVSKAPGLIPNGWFDMNAAHTIRGSMELVAVMDGPGPGVARWSEADKIDRQFENRTGWDRLLEWSLASSLLKSFSQAEVKHQMMVTVCELERYYLAHGAYPDSLDAIPAGARVDPFHAKPFCYRVKDGQFTLYSMGPDGKDDGGVKMPKRSFENQPDWIW